MNLYIIRHAQSKNNLIYDQTGTDTGRSEDPELSETGKQQAEVVAKFLQSKSVFKRNGSVRRYLDDFSITHLYSSLMVRSVETGSIIAGALGIPLNGWKDLHENGGIYLDDSISGGRKGMAGKTAAYFKQHYPLMTAPEEVTDKGWWNREYEEIDERRPRAKRVLDKLLERYAGSDDHVGIVTHGGFYNTLLCVLLNIPERNTIWFSMNNAAITRIDFADGDVNILYTNRVDFMPRELLT